MFPVSPPHDRSGLNGKANLNNHRAARIPQGGLHANAFGASRGAQPFPCVVVHGLLVQMGGGITTQNAQQRADIRVFEQAHAKIRANESLRISGYRLPDNNNVVVVGKGKGISQNTGNKKLEQKRLLVLNYK